MTDPNNVPEDWSATEEFDFAVFEHRRTTNDALHAVRHRLNYLEGQHSDDVADDELLATAKLLVRQPHFVR